MFGAGMNASSFNSSDQNQDPQSNHDHSDPHPQLEPILNSSSTTSHPKNFYNPYGGKDGIDENIDRAVKITEDDDTNIKSLRQTISEMNADFCEKRAMFKSMFLKMEEELETERNLRRQMEGSLERALRELNETRTFLGHDTEKASLIEKLRDDLQKAAKLRSEMEEEWSRLCDEFQGKLSTLEGEISTYELVLQELNTSCQQSIQQMEKSVKKLSIERTEIQKNIQLLEYENDKLQGKHIAHSQKLQNEYISLPNSVMELQEMVLRLKEELICVKIGKEEIEGELNFMKERVLNEEESVRMNEESLNNEIQGLRRKLREANLSKEQFDAERANYERTILELKGKLVTSDSNPSEVVQLKKQNAKLSQKKEASEAETAELRIKIATLRKELANSEDLQRDLIALSKSLQMGLESIRQQEHEVRWQHPDDIPLCNACKLCFNGSKTKFNCNHCGKIFCTDCLSRTVRSGSRDYKVCDFCHTILAQNSAPYFSTQPPQPPD